VVLAGERGRVALETGTGRGYAVPEREGPLQRSCSPEREGSPGTGTWRKGKKSREERKNESLPFVTSDRWIFFSPGTSESRRWLLDLYYDKSYFWTKTPVILGPFG